MRDPNGIKHKAQNSQEHEYFLKEELEDLTIEAQRS